MQQLVWTGPRAMEMRETPLPPLQPGEVRLRVAAVGICGSDLGGYLGHNSLRKPPLVMGHEFSGTVVARNDSSLAIDTPVTVNPLLACGACPICARGLDNLCPQRQIVGIHRPGAFAQFVDVPASACHPLPDGVTLLSGSLAEPLACALRAVRLGGVGPGDRVLVLGAGTLGLFSLAVALRAGASAAIVADPNPVRRAAAAAWGATHTLDPLADPPEALARSIGDGLGADVAIDAVGAQATRNTAVQALRPGGRAVLLGLHEDNTLLPGNHIVRQEVLISGSFAYTRADFAAALRLLAAGWLRPERAWLAERPLNEGAEAFAELTSGKNLVAKIVLRP